jgi:hypothetical protein
METGRVIQRRFITPEHIAGIRALMAKNPEWNRTRISRELCEQWDWRNDIGRIKDMAARTQTGGMEGGQPRRVHRMGPADPRTHNLPG